MFSWLDSINKSSGTPHGHCLLWNPTLIGLQAGADLLIVLAYFSIPLALVYYAIKRPSTQYRHVLWLFGAFITACGITHLLHIWTLWHADYGVETLFKVITALVSLATAVILWPLLPQILRMPSREEVEIANDKLRLEIIQREQVEQEVRGLNESLGLRVAERTAKLENANQVLRTEILRREASEKKLLLTAKVFDSTQEGIIITDADCNIIEVNDAYARITGYPSQELLGQNPGMLKSGHHPPEFYADMWQSIAASGHWSGEIWNRKKNGEMYAEWLTISTIADGTGKASHYIGISSDITPLKNHEKQLERIAHYDALTGIPNRLLLADRMKHAIAHAKRDQKLLAVCYLDLDGFKPINDTHGHEAGDRVLLEISNRLGQGIRGGDTVARLGGDEFVILLLGLDNEEQCKLSLNRLLEAIGEPIRMMDKQVSLSASVGYTLYPLDDEDPDTLLRHADQAMYIAKQSGKNAFHLYDASHDKRLRAHQESLKRILQGLQNNEFRLYYQPKVDMASQATVSAEALLRWVHPERGLLSPGDFLPIIEHSDMEIFVGEWVIDTALSQLEEWRKNGLDIEISINIAANHLQSKHFVEHLRTKLAEYPHIPPSRLQIEILETAALEDIQNAIRVIESCQELGVGFAIDDFGTGYSSLAYLRNLPIKTIKIDQTFVRDMLTDKGDCAIVQGIIALAKTFGHKTVAEGVETMGHFNALLAMGCESGQGYGIAYPMPAEKLMAWCQDRIDNGPAESRPEADSPQALPA